MAIGFARIEFVKRTNGKNACQKAAYNSRSLVIFNGSSVSGPDIYDWSHREVPDYHEILLPSVADTKFRSPEILWNAVETKEKKCNAVVAIELLLALPDDKVISLQDRIHLTKTFIQTHFVEKGLAAQIDIHAPDKRIHIAKDDPKQGLVKGMVGNVIEEKGSNLTIRFNREKVLTINKQELTEFVERENNWHAHIQITTRRFKENGLEFDDHKARDLMPRLCKGKVVSGPDWGKLWTDHQNKYFEEKGLNLRVDFNGIQPLEHLGPVRMRGRAFALIEEHSRRIDQNVLKSNDPSQVLEKLTERQSVFTKADLEFFLQKHLPLGSHSAFTEAFWQLKDVIPLVDKNTGELLGKFSSQTVIIEEKKILRLADGIYSQKHIGLDLIKAAQFSHSLNGEQRQAFDSILRGNKLACLQGYAGTGKSHLLKSLKDFYESVGYTVRAFGPDSATADVLKDKGFQNTENIYRFLFGVHNSRRDISKGKEIWILDEAGKLGNRPLLELLKEAKKNDVKLILSGDNAQLSSVERGGMFQLFCNRYETQILQDIQRQKDEKYRTIAKDLATGELGSAIDKLSTMSAIRWSSTKKEAIEGLISQWALDTRSLSRPSTLIIAHTNDEVRILNEMVRIIKKQRGELSDKELACETSFGKIYVSVGDRIDFRKNDKEIGVTNGLSGTLVEAGPDKFVVSIDDKGKKSRTITFNPQEYPFYQLGYASTYFRCQGRTVDKAYVLHSPALNKRLFYVGLTRHVNEAFYFVSKSQAYCLADLKRLASLESQKENTLSFTTQQEMKSVHESAQKQRHIQQLKDSNAFIDKMKGYGLSAYDLIKSKTLSAVERYQDRSPETEFFQIKSQDTIERAEVQEVRSDTSPTVGIPPSLNQALKTMLTQEKSEIQQPKIDPKESNVGLFRKNKTAEQFFENRQKVAPNLWNALNTETQSLYRSYFSFGAQASTLHDVVEIESTDKGLAAARHFKEWQGCCGKRNASAYDLTIMTSSEDLKAFLGKKMTECILAQAGRHKSIIERNEKATTSRVESTLQENIEPLLYRLFPEGPYRKDRSSFRFGNKGALSVVHSGEKKGQYYDFEKQEGGGILKLVQRELGLGQSESLQWSKDFLGIVQDIKVPQIFLKTAKETTKDQSWVAVRPDPKIPAPSLENLAGKKLHHYFNEVTRHAYRDADGNLLYYRLRLHDKTDSSKKMTPPLSFGYWKSDPQNLHWELKGFDTEKHTLYNLPVLIEKPLAKVLIVEGEKTADKALMRLAGEDFICITWPGGAGAAKQADWAPLIGRDVIVWPDNDKPGFQAGEDVCRELRKIGVQSLQMIDPVLLQKHLPEKWDLADPLPSNLKEEFIQSLLLSSIQKGVDPNRVLQRLSSEHQKEPQNLARVNELLWRVDDRLRPALEQKMGKQFWKIADAIIGETSRLFLEQDKRLESIKDKVFTEGEPLRRLSWQTLVYEAKHGTSPDNWEITQMRDVIQTCKFPNLNQTDRSIDRDLTLACEKALSGRELEMHTKQHKSGMLNKENIHRQSERIYPMEREQFELSR